MEIIPINPKAGIWGVESETAERVYQVTENGTGTCSCPHSIYRAAPDCKHRMAVRAYLAEQTPLQKAADRAANLTDAELLQYARAKNGTPAGAACWLELAARQAAPPEPKPIPAGVEALLVGATPEERERALAIYR